MAKSYDIIGYTFRAATYCPEHVVAAMTATEDFEGWELADGVRMSVEDNLNEMAAAFGIDRMDERSYDSGDFPKVIFRDQIEDTEYCETDGEPLDD